MLFSTGPTTDLIEGQLNLPVLQLSLQGVRRGCGPVPELLPIVQGEVAVVVEDLLGTGQRDMHLEVRVLELQQALQVASSLHPTKVDSIGTTSVSFRGGLYNGYL